MWCCVAKVDKVDKVGVRRELIQTNELYFFILFFSPVITVGSRFLHFVHFVHFCPEGRGEKKGTGSGIRARTVDAAEPSVNTRECSARPPMMQKIAHVRSGAQAAGIVDAKQSVSRTRCFSRKKRTKAGELCSNSHRCGSAKTILGWGLVLLMYHNTRSRSVEYVGGGSHVCISK